MTCTSTTTLPLTEAYQAFLDQVTEAGLLVPLGVRGVYGYNGVFDGVLQSFDRLITRRAAHFQADILRLRVQATDISLDACNMCFVNTSLWNIPTTVTHGNALSGEVWGRWKNAPTLMWTSPLNS